RPTFTIKALVISGILFLLICLLYSFPLIDWYVWLLVIDRVVVIFSLLLVLFFSVPTEFLHDLKFEKAVKKINDYRSQKNNKLTVIGVTGSYGKSSTKDYTAQILQKRFKVLKTLGTNNTPIGIATTILSGLKRNTQLFVAEMGAYKTGEI